VIVQKKSGSGKLMRVYKNGGWLHKREEDGAKVGLGLVGEPLDVKILVSAFADSLFQLQSIFFHYFVPFKHFFISSSIS